VADRKVGRGRGVTDEEDAMSSRSASVRGEKRCGAIEDKGSSSSCG
jgi:hypothetical protein